MKKYRIREATKADWTTISHIHSISWQENYRGSFSDKFLDYEVVDFHKTQWEKRFSDPAENQYVIVSEDDEGIVGFSCSFGNHDEHGTLLDNLHVRKNYRGHGIGAELLEKSIEWAAENYPLIPFHLYVLGKNSKATKFYSRMGAKLSEPILSENPDQTKSKVLRCTWTNLKI